MMIGHVNLDHGITYAHLIIHISKKLLLPVSKRCSRRKKRLTLLTRLTHLSHKLRRLAPSHIGKHSKLLYVTVETYPKDDDDDDALTKNKILIIAK